MKFRIQHPSAQPTATWRLLDHLEEALLSNRFRTLKIVVAFARVAPLRKLDTALRQFRASGGQVDCVFGVDQKGTSLEALEFAVTHFDSVRVASATGRYSATFHPKIYILAGRGSGEIWVGSNNLTVGGTELNPESLVHLEFAFPEDRDDFESVNAVWDDAVELSVELSSQLLQSLAESDMVMPEVASPGEPFAGALDSPPDSLILSFPDLGQKPPRPTPPSLASTGGRSPGRVLFQQSGEHLALAIQVRPHPNGEVFLSKNAVNQNQDFFGWPFTGTTTPKKATNRPYPQRLPDPVVSIRVVDDAGATVVQHPKVNLNTVYYTPKSEIRVTVPQDVIRSTPPFSILLLSADPEGLVYDYHLTFYVEGSLEYQGLLACCDQTMPSGGLPRARRFGWVRGDAWKHGGQPSD